MSDKPDKPTHDGAPTPPVTELVAYLDGELDPKAAEAVEARLSLDAKARAEVESLKRAWDLLDFLPRPEPSSTFTTRTLERIEPLRLPGASATVSTLASSHPSAALATTAGRQRRLLVWGGWAAAVLGAGLIGYFARGPVHDAIYPPAERSNDAQIVADVQLLENLRLYRHVDDIEFLKELDTPELFGEDAGGQ
jgi:anti-sigma factor RsiW